MIYKFPVGRYPLRSILEWNEIVAVTSCSLKELHPLLIFSKSMLSYYNDIWQSKRSQLVSSNPIVILLTNSLTIVTIEDAMEYCLSVRHLFVDISKSYAICSAPMRYGIWQFRLVLTLQRSIHFFIVIAFLFIFSRTIFLLLRLPLTFPKNYGLVPIYYFSN